MPHFILEHSAELSDTQDLAALADAIFEAGCSHPAFAANPKAVKVRTIACQNIRSGADPQTFAHLTIRLLSGRTIETKAGLADDMLALLDRHLPNVGSLSVEPVDMATETYRKRAL
ncbi:5-carboxymethyl-2-hydroxymuconate isomerase [Shimia sp. SDUM112013]|uniref:5-carboxymethyl-2-hydroxymuconate Delta-isomerase n=1 Tax=Shimia sp. SDUM112013 TaxID=3136160 RepID=UPI0032ECD95A